MRPGLRPRVEPQPTRDCQSYALTCAVGVNFGSSAGDHLHAFAVERIAVAIAQLHVVGTRVEAEDS